MKAPNISTLAPSPELLGYWKRSDKSSAARQVYAQRYWMEVANRCRKLNLIWNGAKELRAQGLEADTRGACLALILMSASRKLGGSELTLCCYEAANDEHCHRKLVYDTLPDMMKGKRG